MTEELLKTIATQGILGSFSVLAALTIFYLYKEIRKERNDRLTDMKDVWQADVKFRATIETLIQNILDILRGKK